MRIRYDRSSTYAPPLDYFLPCQCEACELAKLLWWTAEDEKPREWQAFWNTYAALLTDDDVADAADGTLLFGDSHVACWRQVRNWGMAMTDERVRASRRNESGRRSDHPTGHPSLPMPSRPPREPLA